MYYLCRRKAALGNLKASFHCARLHFLCRRKAASQQNIQASLVFCIRFAFSLHRLPMKVLRELRRGHLLRPRAVTIDDRRRSSIKTQKVGCSKFESKIRHKKWCYFGAVKLLIFNTLTYEIVLWKFA